MFKNSKKQLKSTASYAKSDNSVYIVSIFNAIGLDFGVARQMLVNKNYPYLVVEILK